MNYTDINNLSRKHDTGTFKIQVGIWLVEWVFCVVRIVRETSLTVPLLLLVSLFICLFLGLSLQSQAVDPDQFSSQDSNMMLEQKAPVFPQQYASQTQMAQGSYSPMQDPNFHSMGQRPSYATLRMQPRPSLRPTGLVQNQPNQLRLQLQHRLQAQQVCALRVPGSLG